MLARRRLRPAMAWWGGLLATLVATLVVVNGVDRGAVLDAWRSAAAAPALLVGVCLAYALAFAVRAALWRLVLPGLSFGQALAAIHVGLGANHVLPFRLGEPLRVTSAARRTPVPLGPLTTSTVLLRAADVLALVGIGLALGHRIVLPLLGPWGWAVVAAAAVAAVGGLWAFRRSAGPLARVGPLRLLSVAAGSALAWVLEAAVLWQAAGWAGIPLSPTDAVLVTSVTIAAQILAVAPGGFGTYEAAAVGALAALGAEPGVALAAALTAHALKTAYSLATGVVALFLPRPGIFGRLRLGRGRAPATPLEAPAHGPVVFFLPAHDEEATIANVVRRIPDRVRGLEVQRLVVDDGSTDRTAEAARRAGAEVLSLGTNQGLGAAVRRGLEEARRRGAAAAVFCDADGEYAPEEFEDLVGPLLDGRADYVVGSRFAGTIDRMLTHRRFGNRVLTSLLRFVARHPITDGQSGYRALGAEALAAAEVIHDFNYAQVLTLDLLGKGLRYLEVPISYRFRERGRSFVRLVPYLQHVVPAVHREVNDEGTAVLRTRTPHAAAHPSS